MITPKSSTHNSARVMSNMQAPTLPTLRWGIIGAGAISSLFTQDLVLSRPSAKAQHTITAIGSSSVSKGLKFVQSNLPNTHPVPKLYSTYDQVYHDPNVDIVYIGTPHAFHKSQCLAAISAGKHVLCEKAFTLNARDARDVFAAASEKGVFVMEAMWTRFFPLTLELQRLLHEQKVIGVVVRVFTDFGREQDVLSKDTDSRLRNVELGAGSLLNIGIYSVTWGLLAIEDQARSGEDDEMQIKAVQTLQEGVDVASTVILYWPKTGQQAICTSTSSFKNPSREFCRIEGTKGHIIIEGDCASCPDAFTVYTKGKKEGEGHEYPVPGAGLFWEADAVALDIAAGRKEDRVMPWEETVRIMDILDEVRSQGGARFPQDEW